MHGQWGKVLTEMLIMEGTLIVSLDPPCISFIPGEYRHAAKLSLNHHSYRTDCSIEELKGYLEELGADHLQLSPRHDCILVMPTKLSKEEIKRLHLKPAA